MTIIAQLSDIHLAVAAPGGDDRSGPARALRDAVSAVLALPERPDCLVLTGDLADNGLPAEYARLHALLSPLAMPVFALAGNHDDRAALRSVFTDHAPGDDPAAPFQYAVEVNGVRLVCCDTTVPGAPHGELDGARLAWLDAVLTAGPDLPTVVATHHPPFRVGVRFLDEMGLREPDAFAAVLARHPQVVRVISGHAHRASAGSIGGVTAITCPSTYRQIYLDTGRPGQAAYTGESAGFAVHIVGEDRSAVSHFVPTGGHRPLMQVD
ncbi:phosphodiesterase [Thermomonospora umbrina]|uniref:Calcineurin-like phosphoesterase family protein n=1 Tax=Thermomonospora umbrina TaxID=111806 RepID=A0A3D9SQ99_9ACTN|nr:phosphodiesterase [Thermomonospora umbrina]REE98146.1 calcineurin-like phosphoesterase family protein [Thermomonospora umbrina]